MIWRLLSNNWYSVLVNGQSFGFFRSSRGVKQGDPLSPVLFIIAAEVMSRGLNNLLNEEYRGYGMLKWSPQINHLFYADDTIHFESGDTKSIVEIMMVLSEYEKVSGQLINKSKISFYIHERTPLAIRLKKITGIK